MAQPTPWHGAASTLDRDSIEGLLAGEIPAIHLADFATPDECRAFCCAVQGGAAPGRAATTSPMTLFGGNLSNFRGASPAEYFATVEQSYAEVAPLHAASFDPLARILERLRSCWNGSVEVASEPGKGRYFAGTVKSRREGSALHYDFVPFVTSGYSICTIDEQFSWNLYLAMPDGTGATTVYDAPVRERPSSRRREFWDNLVDVDRVADVRAYSFMPRVGEVVLFNTRYPHRIDVDRTLAQGPRTQVGSFVGRMPGNALVLWS